VFTLNASLPTAVLYEPVVLVYKERKPTETISETVVFDVNARTVPVVADDGIIRFPDV
jgi:hypothetical protein